MEKFHSYPAQGPSIANKCVSDSLIFLFLFRKRMTAQECLLHPWLSGDHSDRTEIIDQSRYLKIRDRIRAKYDAWDSFVLPIGRLSEYSSLRKLLIDKYKIHDAYFGKYQCFHSYFFYLLCV